MSATVLAFAPKPQAAPPALSALDLMSATTCVSPDATNIEVFELFTRDASLVSLPVVEADLPLGLINRNIFMNELARPFHRELFGRKSCIAFMDKQPLVVDGSTPIQELSLLAVAIGEKAINDGFIVTTAGHFVGTGSGMSLVTAVTRLQAEKNRVVMESIHYASVIQRSFLRSSQEALLAAFPHHALHWEPRDVVGGDFYFFRSYASGCLLAVMDCTGHGVPGAFMTLIMASLLDHLVTEDSARDPAALLAGLNQRVKHALGQSEDHGPKRWQEGHAHSDDGMDAALVWLAAGRRSGVFAGAEQALWLLRQAHGQLESLEGDRLGVGYAVTPPDAVWRNQPFELQAGDQLWLTTDGLLDQIGGSKRIAFGKRRLQNVLLTGRDQPPASTVQAVLKLLHEYQGAESRRDDLTLIGITID